MDDYDYWIDITVFGVAYEERVSRDGSRHIHRPLKLGPTEMFEERGIGDWLPGKAPRREDG